MTFLAFSFERIHDRKGFLAMLINPSVQGGLKTSKQLVFNQNSVSDSDKESCVEGFKPISSMFIV